VYTREHLNGFEAVTSTWCWPVNAPTHHCIPIVKYIAPQFSILIGRGQRRSDDRKWTVKEEDHHDRNSNGKHGRTGS